MVWIWPPPFDHAKLLVIDLEWTLFGSANWDARSMRLNLPVKVRDGVARVFALL